MNEGLQDYKNQQKSIKNFFPRFPKKPNFKGKTILEFGCGRGAFSLNLANEEPEKIVAIDTNSNYINFAKKSLNTNFQQHKDKINFFHQDINNWKPDLKFDYIISKEAFEHTLNLSAVLSSMHNLLNQNGLIFAGFGPLYNFFNGDHGYTKAILPWFHLILPNNFLINRVNKNRHNKVQSIEQLGLNTYSLKKYREIFYNSKFEIVYFQTNSTSNKLAIPFKILSKINFLEEYCTFNIFIVLKKK
tara:strand:- start:401 stop:1135 length:735 start_codon:yes stop_codon:yes gene_type:complete